MSDTAIDLHEQAARRSHRTLTDTHGRHWSANIEAGPRSGHASGPITPCVGPNWSVVAIMERESVSEERAARMAGEYDVFLRGNDLWPHAPVIPPQKYLIPSRGDSQLLRIDYAQWRTDNRDSHETWWLAIIGAARVYYKDQAASIMDDIRSNGFDKVRHRYLYDLLGEPPMDVRVIDTCEAGKSRWILGMPDNNGDALPRPQWAEEILPRPVVEKALVFEDVDVFAFTDDEPEPETLEEAARPRRGRPAKVAA